MKQTINLIHTLVLLFTISNLYGQFEIGTSLGYNYYKLKNEKPAESKNSGDGFKVGGFVQYLPKNFGFRIQADYSYANVEGSFYETTLHYISLPITASYRPIQKLSIQLGPELNFLVHQKEFFVRTSQGKFNRVDYGLHMEISYLIIKNIELFTKSYIGLTYNEEGKTYVSNGNGDYVITDKGLDRLVNFGFGINYYLIK